MIIKCSDLLINQSNILHVYIHVVSSAAGKMQSMLKPLCLEVLLYILNTSWDDH